MHPAPISHALGVAVGTIASGLYQGVVFFRYVKENGKWPWEDSEKPRYGAGIFFASAIFNLLVAGCVTWGFMEGNQVSGIVGAAVIGIGSEETIIKLSESGRKEHKDE